MSCTYLANKIFLTENATCSAFHNFQTQKKNSKQTNEIPHFSWKFRVWMNLQSISCFNIYRIICKSKHQFLFSLLNYLFSYTYLSTIYTGHTSISKNNVTLIHEKIVAFIFVGCTKKNFFFFSLRKQNVHPK